MKNLKNILKVLTKSIWKWTSNENGTEIDKKKKPDKNLMIIKQQKTLDFIFLLNDYKQTASPD